MNNNQPVPGSLTALSESFPQVRLQSALLFEPLLVEDYVFQTMPDVSPPKSHLAHVSCFTRPLYWRPI